MRREAGDGGGEEASRRHCTSWPMAEAARRDAGGGGREEVSDRRRASWPVEEAARRGAGGGGSEPSSSLVMVSGEGGKEGKW